MICSGYQSLIGANKFSFVIGCRVNEFLKSILVSTVLRSLFSSARFGIRATEMRELEKLSSLSNLFLHPAHSTSMDAIYMRILCKVRHGEETRTCEEEEFAMAGTNTVTRDDPSRNSP